MNTVRKVYDINDLNVGDYVINGIDVGYAQVKECVHGKRYYAYVDDNQEDINPDVMAYDTDEDYIPCCS